MAHRQPSAEASAVEASRFEGETVEEVLAEVRATLGADAEIVEANKVRRGGLGGFFAKESVEVMARPRAAHPAPDADPVTPASLQDIVAAISAREDATRTEDATRADDAAGPEVPAPSAPAHPTVTTAPTGIPSAPSAPTAPWTPPADSGFEPFAPEAMPRLSTEGGAFSEVLQRIAADAGPEVADAVERLGGPLTEGLRPVGPQAVAAQPAAAPAVPAQPVAAAPPAVPVANPQPPALPDLPATVMPEPEMGLDTQEDVDGLALSERTERLLSWLHRDNLPRTTLTTALRGLPTAPALPEVPGVVVAIVGPRSQAMRLARTLAELHGAGERNIVLASTTYRGRQLTDGQLVTDAAEADRERRSWRRREAPTFVVVEDTQSLRRGGVAWTREVVTALEAHRVIGVVPAGRKVADVATWAQGIGGLDEIALHDTEQTATPFDVLALEVPVGWLDDEAATPDAWADLLLDEVAA